MQHTVQGTLSQIQEEGLLWRVPLQSPHGGTWAASDSYQLDVHRSPSQVDRVHFTEQYTKHTEDWVVILVF